MQLTTQQQVESALQVASAAAHARIYADAGVRGTVTFTDDSLLCCFAAAAIIVHMAAAVGW